VLDHRGDAGLLKHDFRQPHAVRIMVLAPWQSARVRVVPGKEESAKSDFRKIWGRTFFAERRQN
jgi:hypothetical protein